MGLGANAPLPPQGAWYRQAPFPSLGRIGVFGFQLRGMSADAVYAVFSHSCYDSVLGDFTTEAFGNRAFCA